MNGNSLSLKLYNYLVVLLLSLLLSACQLTRNTIRAQAPEHLYLDEKFPNYSQHHIETAEEIFALNDEMKALVENNLKIERDTEKRARKLLKHLFSKDNIGLAYTSSANLTAQQTFNSQQANCMSLTILSYTLAQAAGIPVDFQQVDVPEFWVRNGAYNMLTGHVNLRIAYLNKDSRKIVFGGTRGEIDFDPYISKQNFSRKIVDRVRIIAMFYNNKGAQALVEHNFEQSYAYLKAATQIDPAFASAWGNLAILYKFTHQLALAEQAYLHTLSLDKDNLTAKTNLALLYHKTNRGLLAKQYEQELHNLRNKNPYYHAMLADEAMYRGQLNRAMVHAKKALRLDRRNHEFYLMLARVHYSQGALSDAKKAMKRAIAINRLPDIESRYMEKLNFLTNAETNYQ